MKKFSAKSIMSSVAFLLCAMTANALEITNVNGVMTMDYTKAGNADLNNYNNNADLRKATTKLVIIGNHVDNTVFTNPEDWGIKTLDLSKAVLPSQYSFKKFYNLEEIIWPANGTFVIPAEAFKFDTDKKGALKNVTIPTNCTEVGKYAFTNSVLEDVTIVGPSTILRAESFRNNFNIKDVWVLEGEETYTENGQTKYYCEKTAFSYDITWVQTQIDRVSEAACLHIPENGNKDIFRIPGIDVLTQEILCQQHHESSVNGWQEFIKNSDIIVDQKQIFRTFSDTKPHLFPQCNDINTGLKIYYVVGTIEIDGKQKILIEPLNELSDYMLPANTGVLIYTKKGFCIYESTQDVDLPKIAEYGQKTPCGNINYLMSLQDAPDNVRLSWATTYRGKDYINMFLNNKSIDDPQPTEWGFYTIIDKYYTKDEISYRASLLMPQKMLGEDGIYGFWDGNGDVPPSVDEYAGAKVIDLADEEFDDEATGLSFVTVRTNLMQNNGKFYNAAGQVISEPAKGFYIHNGKKYIK